jgi:hypothetical protein
MTLGSNKAKKGDPGHGCRHAGHSYTLKSSKGLLAIFRKFIIKKEKVTRVTAALWSINYIIFVERSCELLFVTKIITGWAV